MLLAIDPGTDTGWALFDSCRRLQACGLGVPQVGAIDDLIIECPKLRPKGEKNPNAILSVARNAGEWAGRFESRCAAPVRYVSPTDWKGSTPKEIDHRRTFAKLAPEELAALVKGCSGVSPKSASVDESIREGLTKSDKRANILDAIGIGLFGVGR